MTRLERIQNLDQTVIPNDFDYTKVHNLASEAVEKLIKIQPSTIAQAKRISGLTPSDISVLTLYIKQFKKQ